MCVFCDIASGKIPSRRIYEDDLVIAILDISQVTRGHALVLPRKHYDTLLDCPQETADRMIEVSQKIARKQMQALGASGFNILNNGYPVAGQSVMHAHLHVVPRYGEADCLHIEFRPSEKQDLDEVQERLAIR